MTSLFQPRSTVTCLLVCLILALHAAADVTCRISSRFLARGERAVLEVAVTGHKPTRFPVVDDVRGVSIKPSGSGPQIRRLPGRLIEYVFEYDISSYEIGDHTVPAIQVVANTAQFTTEPLDFSVFDPDELKWADATAGNSTFRYASTFKVLNSTPYEGENVPVEIKLYIPRDVYIVDWGIPDFERDGLTAWRMQPTGIPSQMTLLGKPYVSIAYPSTLAPTQTGNITIGPAKIRLISPQTVMDGFLRRVHLPIEVNIPQLKLNSLPLPSDAPSGFENAIGSFKIEVTTPETDVQEGDPIPIVIKVTGSGNLDTLKAPVPLNSLGWKIYEPSREPRADERRELSGSTTFRQFLRPLELKGEIPSFKLVYFNPKSRSYESATASPIPLKMTPAPTIANTSPVAGPPPAASTPIEEMTDILGLIPNAPTTQPKGRMPLDWWIHGLGMVLAATLIGRALWTRHKHRFERRPEDNARSKELRKLEQAAETDHEFLMGAGRFIEHWLGKDPDEEVRAILAERDAVCFRKQAATQTSIDPQRRKTILQTLRKAANTCIAIFIITAATSHTLNAATTGDEAVKAYESARYDKAIELWLDSAAYTDLSADTLYHIGNACYRAGSPGHAALYYRRALARDPNHHQSRQNLRFIDRKYGSLTVQRPDYQYTIAKLPLAAWRNATWTGAWLTVLALLVFPATRHGAGLRSAAIVSLLVGPLIASGGALGWHYFPNDAQFAPITRQAVIIHQDVTLHSDASRAAPQVIQAPVGSVCEWIHDAGKWSYISFASRTHGWVLSSDIRMVIPDKTPTPPKLPKMRADETNA